MLFFGLDYMVPVIRINRALASIDGANDCVFLRSLVDAGTLVDSPEVDSSGQTDLSLSYQSDGIHLRWNKANEKALNYHLDYLKIVSQQRSFPAPKQGAFNQALGKKTRRVIDATGGWGGDSLLMCAQGYHVTIFERQPLMACVLQEAFQRLANSEWAKKNDVRVPEVICADAVSELDRAVFPADCVYLDPMFPSKKKKSAAANKYMQLLHWLLYDETDATALASTAVRAAYPRVAVKRPDYAAPLLVEPNAQFSSKLLHYDVYLSK